MMEMFNLNTILVANFLGVLLVLVMLVSGAVNLPDSKNVKWYLVLLMVSVLFSCIADPLAFCFDGRIITGARFCVYAGNTWLYFANLCSSFIWINVMLQHLNITIDKTHRILLVGIMSVATLLLVVNLFEPIVFGVDAQNRYMRGPLFLIYPIINMIVLADSILVYYRSKINSDGIRFFPVWIYIIPGLLGIVIQSIFYGISVTGPCSAISVAGLVISLQREVLMKDKLTGLYNRYYLDRIVDTVSKSRSSRYTLFMLDMNHFKSINDTFGHSEGDRALVKVSELLTEVVKDIGIVIRYAGDEFVIIIFSQDDDVIQKQIDRIQNAFSEYNSYNYVPYELSVSIGKCKMNPEKFNINEILKLADKQMYENKMKMYSSSQRPSLQ